jgi:hypothetical protein
MRAAIGAVILGVILMLVTAGQRTGADYKHDSHRGDKVADSRGPRQKSDPAPTEWFPDPQRGWVRVEQRPQKERDNQRNKNPDNKGNSWEY